MSDFSNDLLSFLEPFQKTPFTSKGDFWLLRSDFERRTETRLNKYKWLNKNWSSCYRITNKKIYVFSLAEGIELHFETKNKKVRTDSIKIYFYSANNSLCEFTHKTQHTYFEQKEKMAKEKISQIFEEYVKYISKESLLELVNSGS